MLFALLTWGDDVREHVIYWTQMGCSWLAVIFTATLTTSTPLQCPTTVVIQQGFFQFDVMSGHPACPHRPMHNTLAFSAVPLFLGALLSDWAYASSYQIQWANFASWLLAAGLLLTGLALLWGGVDVLRSRVKRHRRGLTYLLLLLATIVLGFINSLVHAMDGWAAMPTGLILSVAVVLLAAAASAVGLSGLARRTT